MAEISEELDALTCDLIGAAIEMLEGLGAGEEFPVLLATDCEDEVAAFGDDTPDGCYRAAVEYVAGLRAACTRYALLYAGVVAEEGADAGGSDALVVEFAERGMEHAWSGYVLWRRNADGTVEVTDPLPAGEEELLFA